MSDVQKAVLERVTDWIAVLGAGLRVALSTPAYKHDELQQRDPSIDPDFDGWLHGDPLVTKNPASRYGDRTPGFVTGNGLGSMEIGAADD